MRLTNILTLIFLTASTIGFAQNRQASNIYLGQLEVTDEEIKISDLKKINSKKGYNNQPSFTTDGKDLYFSSEVEGQTDIFWYTTYSNKAFQVTYTGTTSEYSPTSTLGEEKSVVAVQADTTGLQKLIKIPMGGGLPRVMLEDLTDVGYFNFIDETKIAIYRVSDEAPPLEVFDLNKGTSEIIASDVGRSIKAVGNTGAVAFPLKIKGKYQIVEFFDGETKKIVEALDNSQDFAITRDGNTYLMGQGSKLFRYKKGVDKEWTEVADLKKSGISKITRIAVAAGNSQIAIVSE